MDNQETSILRRLRFSMLGFGIAMGVIFPIYANLFVEWKPGRLPLFVVGAIAAGITVGVFNYWLVGRQLLKPLQAISKLAQNLRQGNLTARSGIRSKDSVGELVNDLEDSMGILAQSMQELDQSATTVKATAGTIRSEQDQSNSTLSGIASTTLDISHTTDDVASSSRKAVLSAENFSHEAKAILIAIEDSSLEFQQLQQQGKTNVDLVQEAFAQITAMRTHLHELQTSIQTIDAFVEHSQKMSRKTTLLALNASIEANAAGDAGKGFAVVAKEVKELSNQSTSQAAQITDQIVRIKQDIALNTASIFELENTMRRSVDFSLRVDQIIKQQAEQLSLVHSRATSLTEQSNHLKEEFHQNDLRLQEIAKALHTIQGQVSLSHEAIAIIAKLAQELDQQSARVQEITHSFRT